MSTIILLVPDLAVGLLMAGNLTEYKIYG